MKPLSSMQWEEARVAFRIGLAATMTASLLVFVTQGITPLFLALTVFASVVAFLAMVLFHNWRP